MLPLFFALGCRSSHDPRLQEQPDDVLSSWPMRYVLWVLKLALFALALTFAVKNTDPVAVRYFLGHEWRAPLIFVMLVFLCLGALLGLLSALGQILRQRREITSLKRQLQGHTVPAARSAPPDVAGL